MHTLGVCVGEVLLPVRVQVRRVGRAPDLLHLLAAVVHAALDGVALLVHAPLRPVRNQHAVGIPSHPPRERVEHVRVDLSHLVNHGKRELQRQQPSHVIGIIEASEQHLALDVVELEQVLQLGAHVHPRLPLGEQVEEVLDRRVQQHLPRIANDRAPRAPNPVGALGHLLGLQGNLHQRRGGLGRTHWPDDETLEFVAEQVRRDARHWGVVDAHSTSSPAYS